MPRRPAVDARVACSVAIIVLLGGWNLRSRRAPPADDWPDEPASFETSALERVSARRADPAPRARRDEGRSFSWGSRARPLPDHLFRGRSSGPASGVFAQILGPLQGHAVQKRFLDSTGGSYLHDRKQGWLEFAGHRWVPASPERVPEEIRHNFPGRGAEWDPDDAAERER